KLRSVHPPAPGWDGMPAVHSLCPFYVLAASGGLWEYHANGAPPDVCWPVTRLPIRGADVPPPLSGAYSPSPVVGALSTAARSHARPDLALVSEQTRWSPTCLQRVAQMGASNPTVAETEHFVQHNLQ